MQRPVVKAKKSLGQNFLIDPNTLARLVDKLDLAATDTVIEIGPGTGLLTERVQPLVQQLIAVEIDRTLAALLQQKFTGAGHVTIVQADVLKTDLHALCSGCAARIIGNIPYYITTPIIFHVLDSPGAIRDMTLLMQKEVGQRIVAQPNSKEYGILSVFSQAYAHVEFLLTVPATVFRPRPKVDSCLVRWNFTHTHRAQIRDDVLFRKLVRTAFNQRRKMLRATLKGFELEKLSDWDLTRRPEDLSVSEWIRLVDELGAVENTNRAISVS
jgi:16S rRNA (adenine1518-N6/adenine1519-N6)-dimethyltransferase